MIIYALAVGNVSVGAMFVGGAIPGVLFGVGFLAMAWYTHAARQLRRHAAAAGAARASSGRRCA